jgi:hypothetical protein
MAEQTSGSGVFLWLLRIAGTLLSVFLFFFGGIFILAAAAPEAVAQHKSGVRAAVGAIFILGGLVLMVLSWIPWAKLAGKRGPSQQEPPGQLSVKAVSCPHCGGQVDPDSASVGPEGTLTLKCGYCQAVFLVQEDPKW